MNHLEALTAEWLDFNGYFVRTAVSVGKLAKGGYEGELDVVGFDPLRRHFLHVECSGAAVTWEHHEKTFERKFAIGRKHARDLFSGIELPTDLDQVAVVGWASAGEQHRALGGGRLVTGRELTAEIITGTPSPSKQAVPESYPLIRTLQFAKMAGAKIETPNARLIPGDVELSSRPLRGANGSMA